MRRAVAGLALSALALGGVVVTTAPAEAATKVAVINFKSGNVLVNGKTITPAHNLKNVKRNTMRIKLLYGCGWIQGLNKDGSIVKNRAYLKKGVTYKGGVFKTGVKGSLDDGTANQFALFDAACV